MYDYLAKIILLGPSGCGKSCLLQRFVKGEWRMLSSQTIGVEFASKIVKIGPQGSRKRIKLQLWDTAGTERFRSVSRSYYRGAAGALLVYDISNYNTFSQLPTFLSDAKTLASPHLAVVLVGNKSDVADPAAQQSLLDEPESAPSTVSGSIGPGLGSQQRATVSQTGRAVPQVIASSWASQNRLTAAMDVSALSGDGVDEAFNKLARTILTKIELGEIDPDDPSSGIQYGDADYFRHNDDASTRSNATADPYGSSRRRARPGALRGWGEVFKLRRSSRTTNCC